MAEENINGISGIEVSPNRQPASHSTSDGKVIKTANISGIMRIIRSIFFIIIGIWSIVLSNKVGDMRTGSFEVRHSYGGDAYTGMQNASAQTSKNTMCSNEILCKGFGSILLIAGMGFITCGATGFKKD